MKILKSNNTYKTINELVILDKLPTKVYSIKYTPFNEPYLEEDTPIVLPQKIYSNDNDFIEQILNYYNKTNNSFGISLIGKKGLGKSFTANRICNLLNLPVIKVKSQHNNQNFLSFLNTIEQDKIVLIDEFDKIFKNKYYNSDDNSLSQEVLLPFLDGGGIQSNNRTIFIITANKAGDISEYLFNRPSRIRYSREYEKLPKEVAVEIIEDLLENQDYKEELLLNLSYKNLNIDLLIEIIKEINIQDKPYSEIINNFNYFKQQESTTYNITAKINDNIISIDNGKLFFNLDISKGDKITYHYIGDICYEFYSKKDVSINTFGETIIPVNMVKETDPNDIKEVELTIRSLSNNLNSYLY